MHNLNDLTIEELKELGDKLLAKGQALKTSRNAKDRDQRYAYSQDLLAVDKELVIRGCSEYKPIVDDFEMKNKAEIESKKNESIGLIGIGVVVMAVTIMLDQGFSLDTVAIVFESLAFIAILTGIIRYRNTPRLIYAC